MIKIRAFAGWSVVCTFWLGGVYIDQRAEALPPQPTSVIPPIIGNGPDGVFRDVPLKYYAAIDEFEASAIASVLETHSLPDSDGDSVKARARDAVRTQEFLDLLAIIAKAPGARTANEALVYEFYQGVYQQQAIAQAQAAVDEYLLWSGLTTETIALDPIPITPAGLGYCKYKPPENVNQGVAPFGLVYNTAQLPQCYPQATEPCLLLPTGCPVPWPSEEQFQLWGRYRSEQSTYDDPVYRNMGLEVAAGVGLTATMVATAAGTAAARSFLAGPVQGTNLMAKVFPYAGKVTYQAGADVTKAAIESAKVAARASSAAIRAASIAFVVGTVITAVLTIALEIWTIIEHDAIHRNLLEFVDKATNQAPNLSEIVQKEAGASALLSTFLSTTAIDVDPDCTLADADRPYSKFPCDNAPPIPAVDAADPVFYVSEEASSGTTGAFTDSIYVINPVNSSDTLTANEDVRLSGNGWFVSTKFDGSLPQNQSGPVTPGARNQSLRLYYADWDGGGRVATRVLINGQPMFAISSLESSDVGSCSEVSDANLDGICLTDTLHYLQPDGTKASAQIVASDATGPDVDGSVPDRAVAGQPVALSATATATFGTGPFTYEWKFPGQVLQGDNVAATFKYAGPNTVTLKVSDSSGSSTTRTFQVLVAQNTDVVAFTWPPLQAQVHSTIQVWARVLPRVSEGTQCSWNQTTGQTPCTEPTGSVQFFVDGVPVGQPVDLVQSYLEPCFASGDCVFYFGDNRTYAPAISLPVNFPAGSTPAITATYYGDNRYVGGTSAPSPFVVTKATPVVTLTSGPQYQSASNPGPITATVESGDGNGPAPSGTVQFTVVAGAVEVPVGGPVPIDSDGSATLLGANLSFVPALKAVYTGDDTYAARASSVVPVTYPVPTSATIQPPATLAAVAGTVNVTITVLDANGVPIRDAPVWLDPLQVSTVKNPDGTITLLPEPQTDANGMVTVGVTSDTAGVVDYDVVAKGITVGSFSVSYVDRPTVTINQGAAQADPTNGSTVTFDVQFSEPVTGFTEGDVVLDGSTVPGDLVTAVSGSGAGYSVEVTGASGSGLVAASVAAGAATSVDDITSIASTTAAVEVDQDRPTVTVEQDDSQPDPTNDAAVVFDVVFSEPVTGFTAADISIVGSTTDGTLSPAIVGSGDTYTVTVTGMVGNGEVVVSVPAASVLDTAGNSNVASTSTDNAVTRIVQLDVATPGGAITLRVAGGQLLQFEFGPLSVPAPRGWKFPFGELTFSASTEPGALVTFELELPSNVSRYFKLDDGVWSAFTWDGETGAKVDGSNISVTIRDNGRGDADPTVGVVADPGAPAVEEVTATTSTMPSNTGPSAGTPATTVVGRPSGQLPDTGGSSSGLMHIASALVLLGVSLYLARRRRVVSM